MRGSLFSSYIYINIYVFVCVIRHDEKTENFKSKHIIKKRMFFLYILSLLIYSLYHIIFIIFCAEIFRLFCVVEFVVILKFPRLSRHRKVESQIVCKKKGSRLFNKRKRLQKNLNHEKT